jgi:hypothetical protein
MKRLFLYLLLFINISLFFAQEITGKVSFVTSQNVYVKFKNTATIKLGDSLNILKNKVPCLVVKNKSSSSVVCSIINNCSVKKGDEIYFKSKIKKEKIIKKEIKQEIVSEEKNQKKEKIIVNKEKIKGRISVSSYSNFSDNRGDRHRLNSRLSLSVKHINNSKISAETYLNYRQNLSSNNTILNQNTFRVYNLTVRYDLDSTMHFLLGRKINNKISSLGAIDGLQVEKKINKNFVGVIAGFRPDFFDYGFNSDLLEYGVYFGRKTETKKLYAQTTLGVLEQKNGTEIDRRYVYFQHNSSINRKLNLFSSLELDLFSKVNNEITNDVRLTNLYLSVRYKFSRKFNLAVSYNSRKKIFYYETFQSQIEQLLDNDITRQGVKIRLNVKPIKLINIGLSVGKRFQSDNQNKSDNIYAYMSIAKIPKIGGRLSFNYNQNTSNYLKSAVYGARYYKTIIKRKLNANIYYRLADYDYFNTDLKTKQNYFGANFTTYISRKFLASFSGELTSSNTINNDNYRIYIKLIKRL